MAGGAGLAVRTRILLAGARRDVRRAASERRHQLELELAAYTSPADLADLEALLDRWPAGSTHEIRSILARQGFERQSAQARDPRRLW